MAITDLWTSKKVVAYLYPEMTSEAGLNALRVLTHRGTLKWSKRQGRGVLYLAHDVKMYGRLRRNRLARAVRKSEKVTLP